MEINDRSNKNLGFNCDPKDLYPLYLKQKQRMVAQKFRLDVTEPKMHEFHKINISYGYRILLRYYAFGRKNRLTKGITLWIHNRLKSFFDRQELKKAKDGAYTEPDYKGDIIFLSIIDWDYRYQRPQHIAAGLAKIGYRVFFINPTFNKYAQETKQGVQCYTFESDFSNINCLDNPCQAFDIMAEVENVVLGNNIRNAVVISEYPTWHPVCARLKEAYGFGIFYDYLDDVRDFTHINHPGLLEECFDKSVSQSDAVFATSQFLFEKAVKKNPNCVIARNGTEFGHFNRVAGEGSGNKKPVVGYYGEISNWFDHELMESCAKALPDYDFLLIGDYTYGNVQGLKQLPNVKLLGEQTYDSLPGYLKSFDVAVIPFDSSRDLIRATNPVKFYEYLSAGKKIVATEIPEISSYHGKYALLSNDRKQFAKYLQMCLEGTDGLASVEERISFAKQNDWTARVDQIDRALKEFMERSAGRAGVPNDESEVL